MNIKICLIRKKQYDRWEIEIPQIIDEELYSQLTPLFTDEVLNFSTE